MERKLITLTLQGDWKNTVEHESNNYISWDWCFSYSHQRIIKGTGELGNKKTSEDHLNYYTNENGQDTDESPGNLRLLAVPHTPEEKYQ